MSLLNLSSTRPSWAYCFCILHGIPIVERASERACVCVCQFSITDRINHLWFGTERITAAFPAAQSRRKFSPFKWISVLVGLCMCVFLGWGPRQDEHNTKPLGIRKIVPEMPGIPSGNLDVWHRGWIRVQSVCVCVCAYVCVCACMRVCVCVYVCEFETETESESYSYYLPLSPSLPFEARAGCIYSRD